MAFKLKVSSDSMAKPTGPTGILSSSRPQTKAGGKRTMGSSKGMVSSPAKAMAGRKMGRR